MGDSQSVLTSYYSVSYTKFNAVQIFLYYVCICPAQRRHICVIVCLCLQIDCDRWTNSNPMTYVL